MIRLFLAFSMIILLGSCSDESSNSGNVSLHSFNRIGLLQDIASYTGSSFETFASQSKKMAESMPKLCSHVADATSYNSEIALVQESWKSMMGQWQLIEAYQFGPLKENAGTLRYDIYSWPLINYCTIDREVSNMVSLGNSYQLSDKDLAKGLVALEYLLFDSDLNHDCTDSVPETSGWNDLSETDRRTHRCRYLQLVSDDLSQQAETLVDQWQSKYAVSLVATGTDTELQERINEVSDSLFFLDVTVKDQKLGIPLAINDLCPNFPCTEKVEHPWSGYSLQGIYQNLTGFQSIFQGNLEEEIGFDDFLSELGRSDKADEMKQSISSALETSSVLAQEDLATQLTGTCPEASADNQTGVCKLYYQIRVITDELKGEFTEILQLQIPQQTAGDND